MALLFYLWALLLFAYPTLPYHFMGPPIILWADYCPLNRLLPAGGGKILFAIGMLPKII